MIKRKAIFPPDGDALARRTVIRRRSARAIFLYVSGQVGSRVTWLADFDFEIKAVERIPQPTWPRGARCRDHPQIENYVFSGMVPTGGARLPKSCAAAAG